MNQEPFTPAPSGPTRETTASDLGSLAKQFGSLLRKGVTRIQQDAPAAAEADLPSSTDEKYPDSIWGYLEGDYHLDLRYLPTRADRDRLDGTRQQIWDYFFRIDPRDVGKPQQREISQLKSSRNSEERSYEQQRRALGERKQILERERMLMQQVLEVEMALQHLQDAPPDAPKGGDLRSSILRRVAPAAETSDQALEQTRRQLEARLQRLKDELTITQQRLQRPSEVDVQATGAQPDRTLEGVEQETADIAKALSDLLDKHSDRLRALDERIESLGRSIELLREQLPVPPSDDQVRHWLSDDLEAQKQRSQLRVAAGTRLQAIASYDEAGSAEHIVDVISIVSPGGIQDAARIPPTYVPPQIGAARDFVDRAIADVSVSGLRLAQLIRPKTIPDRAKHFLAKRLLQTSDGIDVLYGVYYLDFLMILDDMIVLHSFFFDFISGATAAERITEVYFRDIVALETSHEYRVVPLQYSDDPDAVLVLEDVPVLGLILPNGDQHTISFINEAFLRGLLQHIEAEVSSQRGLEPRAAERYVRMSLQDTLQVADNAIKVLRAQVRRHKATQQ